MTCAGIEKKAVIFAVVVGVSAPDIKTHPAQSLEHLGPVASQISRRNQKVHVREIVTVQGTGERKKMQATVGKPLNVCSIVRSQ